MGAKNRNSRSFPVPQRTEDLRPVSTSDDDYARIFESQEDGRAGSSRKIIRRSHQSKTNRTATMDASQRKALKKRKRVFRIEGGTNEGQTSAKVRRPNSSSSIRRIAENNSTSNDDRRDEPQKNQDVMKVSREAFDVGRTRKTPTHVNIPTANSVTKAVTRNQYTNLWGMRKGLQFDEDVNRNREEKVREDTLTVRPHSNPKQCHDTDSSSRGQYQETDLSRPGATEAEADRELNVKGSTKQHDNSLNEDVSAPSPRRPVLHSETNLPEIVGKHDPKDYMRLEYKAPNLHRYSTVNAVDEIMDRRKDDAGESSYEYERELESELNEREECGEFAERVTSRRTETKKRCTLTRKSKFDGKDENSSYGDLRHDVGEGDNDEDAIVDLNTDDRNVRKNRSEDKDYMVSVEDEQEFQEGQDDWEASDDFEGVDDPLLVSLRIQRRQMTDTASHERSAERNSRLLKETRPICSLGDYQSIDNVKDRWHLDVQAYQDLFFESDEAKLRRTQNVEKDAYGVLRAAPFYGVKVNEKNNFDVLYCYNKEYGGRFAQERMSSHVYGNFLVCMGQLARTGIALQKLDKMRLWKRGEFFKIAECIPLFELFITHFSRTSTATTIMNKANQLHKFVNLAIMYFDTNPKHSEDPEKNNQLRSKMILVSNFLRRSRASNKAIGKRLKSVQKEDEFRESVGKKIGEQTLTTLQSESISTIHALYHYFITMFTEKDALDFPTKTKVFRGNALDNFGRVQKWNINFIALLVSFGNGQRNQVYTFLRCPRVSYLEEFGSEKGGVDARVPLKIYIHEKEKRARDSRLPFIMLDPSVFPYVNFHTQFVQPFILAKYSIEDGSRNSQKLLLDTRNGRPVSSDSIRNTFRNWVHKHVDKHLRINPTDIRAAYATIMIRRHARRNSTSEKNLFAFRAMQEEEFMTTLACVMNTSVEQIRQVYAAASHENYADYVARVMNIVREDEGDERE